MDTDPVVVTHAIAPSESVPMTTKACAACVSVQARHSVTSSVSAAGPTETPTFFSEDGSAHHHSWKQEIRVYQCSNGHTYADRLIIECPTCGWTIDRDIADS